MTKRSTWTRGEGLWLAGALLLCAALLAAGPASAQRAGFVRPPGALTLPDIRPVPRRTTAGVRPPFFREPTIAEQTRDRRALRRRLDASEIDPRVPQARGGPTVVPGAGAGTLRPDPARAGTLLPSGTGIPATRIEIDPPRPRRP